jgi:hypothetical protein
VLNFLLIPSLYRFLYSSNNSLESGTVGVGLSDVRKYAVPFNKLRVVRLP